MYDEGSNSEARNYVTDKKCVPHQCQTLSVFVDTHEDALFEGVDVHESLHGQSKVTV
jgi:predicted secreted Zn-dependent protease